MASILQGGDVQDVTVTHEVIRERRGPNALTDDDVRAITNRHIDRAVAFCFDTLGSERNAAMEYYLGLAEGDLAPPDIPDRSRVVSTDVSDTVEWLLPALMSIFTAGPSVVEFVPRKEGDEDQAEQATEYLNYIFYQQNAGWQALYTWFKDALIQKVGVIKVWWDSAPEVVTEFYRGLTEIQFTDLMQDETVEPVAHTSYPDPAALRQAEVQYAIAVERHARQQAMIETLVAIGWPQPMAEQAAVAAAIQRQGPQMQGADFDPARQAREQAAQAAQQQRQQQAAAQQAAQAPQGPQAGPAAAAQPTAPAGAAGAAAGPQAQAQAPMQPQALPLLPEPEPPDPAALPQLHDIRLKRTKAGGRIRVEAVPPEEFIIEPDIRGPREGFTGHRVRRSISWLRERGYPNVDEITSDLQYPGGPAGASMMGDSRYALQDRDHDRFTEDKGHGDESMREVWLTECYLPLDVNGDGIAEWRRIVRAGNAILENEECDGPPWASLCPVPIPHVFFGRSEAELAMPAQRVKTMVLRNSLDNLAFQTNARTFAVVNQVNLDDLLTNRPGGVVRMQAPGMAGPFGASAGDPAAGFQMLQYADEMKQDSTGITRYTQGSDADTLNKTASGLQNITNRADMRVELIARIFAETGVKDLFWLMLKLAAQYQDRPAIVRLTGKWVNIDPREWFNRFDMQVNVGLGTGNRDKAVAHLQQIMQIQQAAAPFGFANPKNMYNTAAKLTAVLGFKDANQFFTDPDTLPPPPPPQPDPQVQAIREQTQAALQIENAKNTTRQEEMRLQAQLDAEKHVADEQFEREKLILEDAQEREKEERRDARERDEKAAELALEKEKLMFQYGVHPLYEGITFMSSFRQMSQALAGQSITRPAPLPPQPMQGTGFAMPAGSAMPGGL